VNQSLKRLKICAIANFAEMQTVKPVLLSLDFFSLMRSLVTLVFQRAKNLWVNV